MHILIIDGDKRSRELGARFLSEADHEVEIAGDAASGRSVLNKRIPEVILLDMYAAGGRLHEFIKWIRALDSPHRPYLILTLSKPGFPAELATALTRGADDFVRKPWLRDELIFRAETIKRMHALQSGHDKLMDWSDESDISALACWQNIELVLANDLSEVLCSPLVATPVQEGLLHSNFAAEIPMTMTQHQVQVQIGIGLDQSSASRISQAMFDMEAPPVEVIQDLLREFANTAGGAFKRSAEQEQIDITTGLPTDIEPGLFSSAECVDRRHFRLSTPDDHIQIFVEVELRSKGLNKIKISELQEGMVLSKDLLNASGMLLVRSGTRLTSSNVSRLCNLVPDHMLVEVAA
jgi:DNA-binding response OmpR family regulator